MVFLKCVSRYSGGSVNGSTSAVSYISGSGKKARPPRPFRSLSVLRLLYEHMRSRDALDFRFRARAPRAQQQHHQSHATVQRCSCRLGSGDRLYFGSVVPFTPPPPAVHKTYRARSIPTRSSPRSHEESL